MKKKEVLNSRIVISGFSGVLFVCPGVFGVLLYLLGFRDLTLQSMDGIVVLYDRVLLEIPLCTLENWSFGVRMPPVYAEKLVVKKLVSVKRERG